MTQPDEVINTMRHEVALESAIRAKGLNAQRITPDHIDSVIHLVQYYQFPGTTVIVCCLTLRNGYCVIGSSSPVSSENFDHGIGTEIAYENARSGIWALEGYLLKESLHPSTLSDPASVPAHAAPREPVEYQP